MNDAIAGSEIRLHKNTPLQDRFVLAGFSAFALILSACGLATWAESGFAQAIAALVALVVGVLMMSHAAFSADELWTIALDTIVVEKKRPLGQPRIQFIRREEISEIRIDRDKANPACFRLALQLNSGERLTSPPLPEITHVRETTAQIAEQLGVVDIDPPENPLDATNAEMKLGEPVRPAIGRDIRIITLIIAGLCTIPYAYKFWNGLPLAIGEIIFLIAGPVIGFLFFRYAHMSAGSFWIVRQGELHVERLSRDGQPSVDTITGGDVDTIAMERDSKTEEERYVVRINLLSKQKFLSPGIGTRDETREVLAEIALRLGIAPERVRR